jgi:hypothetical protein
MHPCRRSGPRHHRLETDTHKMWTLRSPRRPCTLFSSGKKATVDSRKTRMRPGHTHVWRMGSTSRLNFFWSSAPQLPGLLLPLLLSGLLLLRF